MTHSSVHKLGPSPPALAAAIVVSRQLLLTEKSSVAVEFGILEVKTKLLALRASRMTAIPQDQGYMHSGINE